MLGRVLGVGTNKNWVFKNGQFYIEPANQPYQIIDGKIRVQGYKNGLLIPYQKPNEIIFIRYKCFDGVYVLGGSVSQQVKVGSTGFLIQDFSLVSLARGENIVGVTSDKMISFGVGAIGYYDVSEIWTEKVGS